jgi:anti-sigma-K factor RskA
VDIQQFISSGIIEAYVLGMASDEEVRELESLSAQHPEIAAAIEEAQQSMEDFALLHAVEPPAGMKDQIWAVLEQEQPGDTTVTPSDNNSNVRTFTPRPEEPMIKRSYGPMAAAVVALLIGSVVLNFIFWSKNEKTSQELAAVKTEQEKIVVSNQEYKARLDQSARDIQLITDPAMKPVALAGVGTHTQNQAMVFWDTRSKEVYLALKNMPAAPSGKQYQLWAIVDGKPVDAGVFAKGGKGSIYSAIPDEI